MKKIAETNFVMMIENLLLWFSVNGKLKGKMSN